jgi:hypothetical protein
MDPLLRHEQLELHRRHAARAHQHLRRAHQLATDAASPPLRRRRDEAQVSHAGLQRTDVRAADDPVLRGGREDSAAADRLGDLARPGPLRALEPQPGLTDGVCRVDDADEPVDEDLVAGLVGGEQLDVDRHHER